MNAIGLLGFGEAGAALAAGLSATGHAELVAFDLAQDDDPRPRQRAAALPVRLVRGPAELATSAGVIVSAVVCTEAEAAAESVAGALHPGTWYLDINSTTPDAKARIAARLSPLGVRYVDVAVMANISSDLATLPLLTSGEHAGQLERVLGTRLNARVVSPHPGDAARIKLFRSVMVKGLEALALESLSAAYPYGAHEEVLASLEASFGDRTLGDLIRHLLERHAVHGARRAEELDEARAALTEAGVPPIMAAAGYQRLRWDVDRHLQTRFSGLDDPDWRDVLAELERLRRTEPDQA